MRDLERSAGLRRPPRGQAVTSSPEVSARRLSTPAIETPAIELTWSAQLVKLSIMGIETSHLLGAVAMGVGATLVMDLWNLFLKRTFNTPSLDYCLLGRWLRHMPGGTFRHARITAAPQKPFECTVGWIAHYTIGVTFALVFVVLTSDDWLARPTLLPALLYGIATIVFPFFILQPSFGLGIVLLPQKRPNQRRRG
jgi:Protein of unknown function (DUF2938)